VRGTIRDVYVHEDGETPVAWDLADTTIEILVENEDGGFDVFEGAGRSDGRFEVEDVPEGIYYLRLPDLRVPNPITQYLHTDERELEVVMQRHVLRSDGVEPSDESILAFDLTGLVASDTSFVHITAPDRGWANQRNASSTTFEFEFDMLELAQNLPTLVHLLNGDDLYVTQLVPVSRHGNEYHALDRSLLLTDITHEDGTRLELAGELTSASEHTLTLDVRGSAFASTVASLCPGETAFESTGLQGRVSLDLDHEAGRVSIPVFNQLEVPTSDGSITVSYGDPTPADWEASVSAFSVCQEDRDGALPAFAQHTVAAAALEAGTPLAPTLGPVINIEVEGQDGQQPATIETETPRVTWSVPSQGSPAEYSLFLASEDSSLQIHTRQTAIRIPPDLIEEDQTHSLFVTARDYRWATEARRQPTRHAIARGVFPNTIRLTQ
jgi:hypothetical protein